MSRSAPPARTSASTPPAGRARSACRARSGAPISRSSTWSARRFSVVDRFLEEGWPRRFMPPQTMRALERAYAQHGAYGIFFSRFLPGIRAGVTPFAGVVGISPLRALAPSAAASAIWYAFLAAAGAALGLNLQAAKGLLSSANRVLTLVSVAVVMLAALWLWRRHKATRGGTE